VVHLGNGKIVPSCATKVEDGMVVETRSPQVDAARRTALELLLSDHAGDCLAPCTRVCPAHMDIPRMIRQIAAGSMREAIATIKAQIALPAVLGRICPAPCEKGCRRLHAGGSLSVCLLKRYAAEADLASGDPYRPARGAATGRRVAVVGSGPAGLSAAYYLALRGHAVTVFDEHQQAGGTLRYAVPEDHLPRALLDAEIAQVRRLGVQFELGVRIARFAELRRQFDAVLLATGVPGDGAKAGPQAGVFAAGGAVHAGKLAVRSGAEGKAAAGSINLYLAGIAPADGHERKPFSVTLAQLRPAELAAIMQGHENQARHQAAGGKPAGLSVAEVAGEVERCLHCDCRKADACALRGLAERYGADPQRYGSQRPAVTIIRQQAGVIFEPGKCIDCGLCIQIAAKLGEPVGLTFVGRGLSMRPGVPFHASWDQALTRAAEACVRACPTGAIARQDPAAVRIEPQNARMNELAAPS
jgi:ferredoxin